MASLSAELAILLLEDFPELGLALNPPDWHRQAACRGEDTATFFPGKGARLDRVRAICAGCPVRRECAEQAVVGHEAGVWGGTTERDRQHVRAVA